MRCYKLKDSHLVKSSDIKQLSGWSTRILKQPTNEMESLLKTTE